MPSSSSSMAPIMESLTISRISVVLVLLAISFKHCDSTSSSDHRPKPHYILWKQPFNGGGGSNNKKSLLNDEGLRFKKIFLGPANNPSLSSYYYLRSMMKKDPLIDDEGLRFKKPVTLIDDEGMRFKKGAPTLIDDEGMRFKKGILIGDEGMRFKKDPLIDDEGLRFKKGTLIQEEGMRFKKDPLIDDEGLRFKKADGGKTLIDDEGMRFKKESLGDRGSRLKKTFVNMDDAFRFKKNPDDLIDKNLIIRKSVLEGEGLRFKKDSSLLAKEGMRFKKPKTVEDSTGKWSQHSNNQFFHANPFIPFNLGMDEIEPRRIRFENGDILNGEGMRF